MSTATSKSGNVRIATSKYVKTCHQLGLTTKARAGWILAWYGENTGKRVLIHTGKKGTNCVELVGFESEYAIEHPCSPAKTMTQMLLHSAPMSEREILRNFFKIVRSLTPIKVPAADPAQSTDIPGQTTEEVGAPVEMPVAS